jgi:hypothetical protein
VLTLVATVVLMVHGNRMYKRMEAAEVVAAGSNHRTDGGGRELQLLEGTLPFASHPIVQFWFD